MRQVSSDVMIYEICLTPIRQSSARASGPWPFSAEDVQNSMARNPCPHVSFAAPIKQHVTRSYRLTRISEEAEHQVDGTTGSQWRGNQTVKGDAQPFLA